MPRSFKRSARVSDLIHKEIALQLKKYFKDPKLNNVVITEVQVTDDLSQAKVYFTTLKQSQSEIQSLLELLNKISGKLRHLLATHIDLRYTPSLHFYYDETFITAERLDRLFNQIDKTEEQ